MLLIILILGFVGFLGFLLFAVMAGDRLEGKLAARNARLAARQKPNVTYLDDRRA